MTYDRQQKKQLIQDLSKLMTLKQKKVNIKEKEGNKISYIILINNEEIRCWLQGKICNS